MAIEESASGPNSIAITGTATGDKSRGVVGRADGTGVKGEGTGTGVWGHGKTWMGVYGFTESTTGGAGVMGEGNPGPGVIGKSTKWIGVYGETEGLENGPAGVWGEHKGAGTGVKAVSKDGAGLAAYSATHEAVHAETKSPGTAAIAAYNLNPSGTGAAVFAKKEGTSGHAGFFVGNVWIEGELGVKQDVVLANADGAEDFDVRDAQSLEPGTVMVLGDDGVLSECRQAYDRRVAGIVSGAGHYKPGIVLDKQRGRPNRKPIALFGKVYCKVDADAAPIQIGDLLTTSDRPGYAMKANDPTRAFGSVIGKALRALPKGTELIPVLVSLQ